MKYEKTKQEKSTKVCKKPLRFIMEFSSYSTLLLSLIYALTDTHILTSYVSVCVSLWNVSQAQNNGKSRWHLKVVRAFHLTMWAELESQAVITYAHTWTHIVIVPIDWRTSIWSVEQTKPINCRFLRRAFLLKRCGNLSTQWSMI